MTTLYHANNTIAAAVAIVLDEVGAEYELKTLSFADADQTKPDFLKVNPKGRVPALVTEHGTLTEASAIMEYAAAGSHLIPADAFQAGRMRELMGYFASTMHICHAHRFRGYRWADQETSFEDMRQKVPHTMAACCAYIEETYTLDPFVVGESFTLADPYLVICLSWAKADGVDLSQFPKISAYLERVYKRPSIANAISKGMFAA